MIGKSKLLVSTVCIVLAVMWIMSPFVSSAEQWVVLTDGKWYYDSNSVRSLPDNKVQVSAKIFLPSVLAEFSLASCQSLAKKYSNNKGDVYYAIWIEVFNCTTRESQKIDEIYYDKNENLLCRYSVKEPWEKVSLDRQDLPLTILYHKLCK